MRQGYRNLGEPSPIAGAGADGGWSGDAAGVVIHSCPARRGWYRGGGVDVTRTQEEMPEGQVAGSVREEA